MCLEADIDFMSTSHASPFVPGEPSPQVSRTNDAISTKIGGFGQRVRNGTKLDSNARHQVARRACARPIPLDPPWEAQGVFRSSLLPARLTGAVGNRLAAPAQLQLLA